MSAKAQDYHKRLSAFMTEFVFPAEASYEAYRHEAGPNDHTVPPIVEELKVLAKELEVPNRRFHFRTSPAALDVLAAAE